MSGLKQSFVTKLSDVNSTAQEVLGSLRVDSNDDWFKYVQILNSATVAGAVSSLVVYFAATGYFNNRVCTRAADGDATMPIGAGILMGAVTGAAGVAEYGWIQVKGPATLSVAVTSAVAGQSFKMSTTNATGTINTLVTDNRVGVCLNGTTGAYLDCPF